MGGTQKVTRPVHNYKSEAALGTGVFPPAGISVPRVAQKEKRPGVRPCGQSLNVRLYLRSMRPDCLLRTAFCLLRSAFRLLLSAYCLLVTEGGLDSDGRFV